MERSEKEIRKEKARKRLEARQQRAGGTRDAGEDAAHERPRRTPTSRQRSQNRPHKRSGNSILASMLESYGFKFIVGVGVVALLVLAFIAGSFLRSCASTEQTQQSASNAASIPSTSSASTTASTSSISSASTTASTSSISSASTTASTSSAASTSNTSNASSTPSTSSASSTASTSSAASVPESTVPQTLVADIASLALQKKAEAQERAEAEAANDIHNILENDLAEKLLSQAKTNTDAAWIAEHPSEYAFDGWEVQYKILKLAAEEPLARAFVRNWPSAYPSTDQNTKSSAAITGTTTGSHNIPQLFQWDPRWGYTVYSSASFGITGCCPTALAMVYQGLTGNEDMTPYDMGVLAANDGYMSEFEGTDAYFLINEAAGLGLNCYEIYLAPESMVDALEAGRVLIANVGPGDFTTDGHFIVITGLQDGKLIVNDPYSQVRSERLWEPQEIIDQSRVIFAYAAA